jgi:hypothetical protein
VRWRLLCTRKSLKRCPESGKGGIPILGIAGGVPWAWVGGTAFLGGTGEEGRTYDEKERVSAEFLGFSFSIR